MVLVVMRVVVLRRVLLLLLMLRMLTRVRVVMRVLRVRQSFVLHRGLDAQVVVPELGLMGEGEGGI